MTNLFKAISLYRGLGEPERQLIRQKRIAGEAPPTQWLAMIDRLSAFDRACDSARGWTIFLLVIGIIGAIGTGIAAGNEVLPGIVPLAVLAVTLLVIIPLLVFFKKQDLPNRLRNFVAQVIAILREDMKDGAILTLDIALGKPTDSKNLVRKEKVPREKLPPRKLSRTNSYYTHPWFNASGKFADGTAFAVELTDHVVSASIKQRGQRGKIKFKSKSKVAVAAQATVRPAAGLYEVADPNAGGPPPIPGEGAGPKIAVKAKASGAAIRVRRQSPPQRELGALEKPPVDLFLQTVGDAMRQLRPAHANASPDAP
ncbi:MAG: hypothetical protein R3F11_30530 [Verrucomicrobiales bacterium]